MTQWLVPVCNEGTVPCGVVLGATFFDSFRCQQNYWCWLATLTEGTWGFSAVKAKVVLKVNVVLGTSVIRGNCWMKEAVRKGDCDVGSTQGDEGKCVWNRLWDLDASLWSREGAVMCDGCLSPHTGWWVSSQFLLAFLPSCSGTGSFVLLCHWFWLWTLWRDVTNLGCKMEIGEHYHKVPPSLLFVNFTHRGQSSLLPTYFLFRSYIPCPLFQPILILIPFPLLQLTPLIISHSLPPYLFLPIPRAILSLWLPVSDHSHSAH